jgi:hypothetical protein
VHPGADDRHVERGAGTARSSVPDLMLPTPPSNTSKMSPANYPTGSVTTIGWLCREVIVGDRSAPTQPPGVIAVNEGAGQLPAETHRDCGLERQLVHQRGRRDQCVREPDPGGQADRSSRAVPLVAWRCPGVHHGPEVVIEHVVDTVERLRQMVLQRLALVHECSRSRARPCGTSGRSHT